ncbi:terpene synthase family protein [Algoriphagus sp. D3-2-R+10]|uniref:terpene synthase family protein n=1 Tax=Algoriphagus aurantiacus TaxID=3103948 RepID=UPI002B3B34B8|nr:terpene synthase family protein [Algoriphagus sp. D3-2-R+10]MEB2778470.1 terpene synthase family protein [Algoriphagus sp. D3-2-R+10]
MRAVFEFPIAINRHCKTLDVQILNWAWKAGLFEDPAELERCRLQKINWFAGYLFPEELPERLELIMKFFLGLFLLDDLLDIAIDIAMIEFLEGLKTGNSSHANERLACLGSILLLLHKAIRQEYESPIAEKEWNNAWLDYLEALQWETQTKIDGIPPVLKEYRFYRPIASGVYMAMLLVRKENDMRGCISELLELSMARYICLSNDLASYLKELAIGDSHNEVLLLMESMGDTAIPWVQKEVNQLRKWILLLADQVCKKSDECDDWIRGFLLLAGGCGAWTAETSRYQAYINGSSRSH